MKLYSIIWWASFVFWMPNGQVADYSQIVATHNEGVCKFKVQTLAKKNNIPYQKIPKCIQSTQSTYEKLVDAKPLYFHDIGPYSRIVYRCPPKGRCREVE